MGIVLPKPLAPGDCIAVVAPAGPFDREIAFAGMAWLRARYRLRASARLLSRSGYLAGSDAGRRDELARAMRDPEVRAIVCARGGYGTTRIMGELPWDALQADPKWIVGFSDVTALLMRALAVGVASVHAPNMTGLGFTLSPSRLRRSPSSLAPITRAAWLAALERRTLLSEWTMTPVVAGSARGPLVGGNLALLETLSASGALAVPDGSILMLEDVSERPYRIDRMLTALRAAGILQRASAIVFGSFEQCEPAADGVTVHDVLVERTRDLGIPVCTGAPFGHGERNDAFIVGLDATLAGGVLRAS